MRTINFFDKNRILLIQFSGFRFVRTQALKLVYFDGKVNFDFFHVDTSFECEVYDLNAFLISLIKMYDNQQKQALFHPLSGNIIIRMEQKNQDIKVSCLISNNLNTGNLEFSYFIDQSFLPELIKEIETILNEI